MIETSACLDLSQPQQATSLPLQAIAKYNKQSQPQQSAGKGTFQMQPQQAAAQPLQTVPPGTPASGASYGDKGPYPDACDHVMISL